MRPLPSGAFLPTGISLNGRLSHRACGIVALSGLINVVASVVGVPQSNITFWQQIEKPPRSDVLPALAEAFGVLNENDMSPRCRYSENRCRPLSGKPDRRLCGTVVGCSHHEHHYTNNHYRRVTPPLRRRRRLLLPPRAIRTTAQEANYYF